jgi:hypothetical protein
MTAPYKVERAPHTLEQFKEIDRQAETPLHRRILRTSLAELVAQLETAPQNVGEPTYNTARPGGIVNQGLFGPFGVRFALFEEERLVFLFHLQASR